SPNGLRNNSIHSYQTIGCLSVGCGERRDCLGRSRLGSGPDEHDVRHRNRFSRRFPSGGSTDFVWPTDGYFIPSTSVFGISCCSLRSRFRLALVSSDDLLDLCSDRSGVPNLRFGEALGSLRGLWRPHWTGGVITFPDLRSARYI